MTKNVSFIIVGSLIFALGGCDPKPAARPRAQPVAPTAVPAAIAHLVVQVDAQKLQGVASAWRWLLPTDTPILATKCGDLFLQRDNGWIMFLNVGLGESEIVANSHKSFVAKLNDQDFVGFRFLPLLVEDLEASGLKAGPGQCYSFKRPPILGGVYEISNFEVTDIDVHFSLLGQIHEQVKDLPDGASVGEIKIK
ncbi:MAG: T6SS immunity protein Tdi1 domain-containing protein [Planctomycetota bacterium]